MLVKTPKGKEMADSDVYAFNNKFTDRQRKIKMSLLVTKASTRLHVYYVMPIPICVQRNAGAELP